MKHIPAIFRLKRASLRNLRFPAGRQSRSAAEPVDRMAAEEARRAAGDRLALAKRVAREFTASDASSSMSFLKQYAVVDEADAEYLRRGVRP